MIIRTPIRQKLEQCIDCPPNTLKPVWKRDKNKPLCRYHAMMRTAKNNIHQNTTKVDEDKKFYEWIWAKRPHYCMECGAELYELDHWFFHHVLPKSKYKYFRHDERNIVLLCRKHHGEAESATSYPKMKVFSILEEIKRKLLDDVGITYESKTQIANAT